MEKLGFGIDIGGTSVKMGIVSQSGRLIDTWEIETRKEAHGAYILGDIAKSVKKAMESHGYCREDIAGAGLGVPAPLNCENVIVRSGCLGWRNMPAALILSELLDMPVKTGNDANLAALGEQWLGNGAGYKNVVMVTLGTGVGCGIIVNGQILNGAAGSAGEIGHMSVRPKKGFTALCKCGLSDCLQQVVSGTGIMHLAQTMLFEQENLTAKHVFDAAKAGDKEAEAIVLKAADYLGDALCRVAVIVDPEIFIIGGGVSGAGMYFLKLVKASFQEKCFYAVRDTEFALSALGKLSGMYGAARLVFL